ncbi:MAG: aconitate hydratase AcnA [Actinobacteria bacterium]|nr:aconitate hydratase AcnA [Actinomycetota bacterium]
MRDSPRCRECRPRRLSVPPSGHLPRVASAVASRTRGAVSRDLSFGARVSLSPDPFNARATLSAGGKDYAIWRLGALGRDLSRTPYVVKILIENVLRNAGGEFVGGGDVSALADWSPNSGLAREVPLLPARVVMQDFTGVPCVVDLAAMRDAMRDLGADPSRINPLVPADLVIDHSVQVDFFGTDQSFAENVEREYERNAERYALLRWAQQAFKDFRAVPPGTGIVHQVNLEYLASVVATREVDGEVRAYPDSLVGTDSHTTMISGIGILGFGVGGIEAEANLLGQPINLPWPVVVGVKLTGELQPGATATDLVLTLTEMLRAHGVVGKFVEYYGDGLSNITLADRATIANMGPEYGATTGIFPVDAEALRYLETTGRGHLVPLVEAYHREQGMFREDGDPDPQYDEHLALDLGDVVPSLSGPRRPQDRVVLPEVGKRFMDEYPEGMHANGGGRHYDTLPVEIDGEVTEFGPASVAIAAITSCTNTSNPYVMVGAGLVAKRAVEKGLTVDPTVKTSFAPGSQVVTGYMEKSGLMDYLDQIKFNLVGYGCTTCIGNSGPLDEPVTKAIEDNGMVVAAVLSGNRNFEGRVHPNVKAAFLASPPLVVAFALAGRVDIDLTTEPIGTGSNGQPVMLADIWPSADEVREVVEGTIDAELFREYYASVFDGDERWRAIPVPAGDTYAWDSDSTYVQLPPFFEGLTPESPGVTDIVGARALAVLGDSVTTDHISPAGVIPTGSPAGEYLIAKGVEPRDFNSFGSRRGNHEVMMRGTFGNIRLRNALAGGKEGNWTEHVTTGEVIPIYDASMRYQADGVPLVVLAGKEYGSGSSRDWAAKGTALLGVRAVIARSFERIHRGNLVGMGVLPLQFLEGESAETLGLSGHETFTITGLADMEPRAILTVQLGDRRQFQVQSRIDGPNEMNYLRNGGILPTVLRRLYKESAGK